jgi:voltage-gated potassium channel
MTEKPKPPAADQLLHHRWRFGVVLLASLLLTVGQPLMAGLVEQRWSFGVFFSLLIAVVLLIFEHQEHRRMALLLSVAAFLGIWSGHGIGGPFGRVLLVNAYLLAAGFFAFALYGILHAILARQISGDAVFGAVCGYVLLGIIWSLLYLAVETGAPGSFQMPSSESTVAAADGLDAGAFTYFSFITLATVGYGDVTPTTPLARTLTWTQAVAGQFYLAVLVAGLVGLKVAQATRP